MAQAKRDDNYVPTLLAVSNADGVTPVTLYADPTTHRLLVSASPGTLDDLTDVVITSGAQGDILYHNGTNWVNLAAGTNGHFLKTQGAGANPTWAAATAGAAGSDTQVQFNDGGVNLGGDAGLVYNKTTDALSVNGGVLPITSDTGALGSTTKMWADLFLASGAVINFNNGDVTLTHGSNVLTLDGGDLALGANNLTVTGSIAATGARATKGWFTDIESTNMITIGGTSLVATANTWTALQTISKAGVPLRLVNSTDNASVQVIKLEGDRATMADNDEGYASLILSDDGGNQIEYARITWVATDVNVGTNLDGSLKLSVMIADSLTEKLALTGSALTPAASDGTALGTASLMFSDLFLASGAVINFNNGDVTITHSADAITVAGGDLLVTTAGTAATSVVVLQATQTMTNKTLTSPVINTGTIGTSLVPTSNDGAALGNTTNQFSDLFLAEGGVINWDNGDMTMTQAGNVLTIAGGDVVLDKLTTTAAIELGHASDTTIARVSAGVASIEGVNILTVAGGTLTGSITLGENTGIALDPAGSADGKWSGITIAGTAGYAQTYGDLVYLAVADSRWEKTDADASATAGPVMLAMVVVAGAADGSACTLLLQGQIRADAAFPALTVGAPVYVGETAGAIQVAIPTGADNIIRVVGFALTADEIYFNPSMDHQVTVA